MSNIYKKKEKYMSQINRNKTPILDIKKVKERGKKKKNFLNKTFK